MNPYQKYVADYSELLTSGKSLPMGGIASVQRLEIPSDAPKVLIFSPHPDDECIIGALPIRLMRESRMNVINVAVTQGSRKDRQAERFEELKRACNFMGYGLIQTLPTGLEKLNIKTRDNDAHHWNASVAIIASILEKTAPKIIFFPHQHDWNSTHIGTHFLVTDALKQLNDFEVFVVETEFWGQMASPNLMVESNPNDVADMVAGTSFHVGEVTRNPFHLLLPAWMQDNVRRGSELVGGQGEAAPDYKFATLYRLRKWRQGKLENVFEGGKQLSCSQDPAALFS